MPHRDDAFTATRAYQREHRHPQRPPLDVSGLYDLFPERGPVRWPVQATPWAPSNPWPHAARAGVYFVLDADLELLYVGKASQGSSVGKRLSAHFKYRSYPDDRTCVPTGDWIGDPRFVMAVAVPDDSRFEASSLEEYLIALLAPPENTRGKVAFQDGAA